MTTLPTSNDPDVLDVDEIDQVATLDDLIERLHSRWLDGTLTPAELEGLALTLINVSRGTTSNGTNKQGA